MSALQQVIGQVKEQCKIYPDYTDGDAQFQLLEITRVAKDQLSDIESGFRHLAHNTVNSPVDLKDKRTGCVSVDAEDQAGTEDLTGVGRFIDEKGTHVVAYQSSEGFLLAAMGSAAAGYNHELGEEQKLYDGKLWGHRVMQVVIEADDDYSIGLLLTEKQHEVATKALESYQNSFTVRLRNTLGVWTPSIPEKADAVLAAGTFALGLVVREMLLHL